MPWQRPRVASIEQNSSLARQADCGGPVALTVNSSPARSSVPYTLCTRSDRGHTTARRPPRSTCSLDSFDHEARRCSRRLAARGCAARLGYPYVPIRASVLSGRAGRPSECTLSCQGHKQTRLPSRQLTDSDLPRVCAHSLGQAQGASYTRSNQSSPVRRRLRWCVRRRRCVRLAPFVESAMVAIAPTDERGRRNTQRLRLLATPPARRTPHPRCRRRGPA